MRPSQAAGPLGITVRGTLATLAIPAALALPFAAGRTPSLADAAEPAFAPLVLTQLAEGAGPDRIPPAAEGTLPGDYASGARIVLVRPGDAPRELAPGFHSAADPEVSFDGTRLLFAGRRAASDPWDIYEIALDGSGLRRITSGDGNCRAPVYLGSFFTLDSPEPWHPIAFLGDAAGEREEGAASRSTSLYTCRLDGTELRRITFNPSSELAATTLPDGRLLFPVWQRGTLDRGFAGRVALFASQTDGLDYALFAGDEGRRVKTMPAVTRDRLVVFVEGERVDWDGSGTLGAVGLRRNLHSYRPLTVAADGWFHSPSALPDGGVLVSRRPAAGGETHGVYRLDPHTGRRELLFDDPLRHDVQAKLVAPRPPPDGRSSIVTPSYTTGAIYGLNVYESDLVDRGWISPGTPLRLRVLEGLPRAVAPQVRAHGGVPEPPRLPRRFLGEVDVEPDGSFHVGLPAELPFELQLLDTDGLALATCGWLWLQRRENRGCIGCHEDGERTPQNRFVLALQSPAVPLTLEPSQRRTVGFRRDVLPILERKCASAACHGDGHTRPRLDAIPERGFDRAYVELMEGTWIEADSPAPAGRYVHPGRARTSPLIWGLFGRNTSRPWDATRDAPCPPSMPPPGSTPLSADERRTLVEWIDLGAAWDGSSRQE